MKRIIAFIMLAVLLLGFLAPMARAEETTEATEPTEETLGGWFGDDSFRWSLEDGTLTITGQGVMPGDMPWQKYADQVDTIFMEEGIYTVAGGAFRGMENLKEIQFSSSISEIGNYAFQGCTSLEEIRLPEGFKRFGAMCFSGCTSLAKIYCQGYMPRFEEACVWNEDRVYVYYSPERAWKTEDIKPLEQIYGGRLEFLCQDGTDPIPNGENDPKPPAPVAATEPAPTEAPTEPETLATEPPVTVPETTAPTVPETTVPETIPEETLAPETLALQETISLTGTEAAEPVIEEETVRGGFIGLVLILGVITFFIVGALVFKSRSRRGRY